MRRALHTFPWSLHLTCDFECQSRTQEQAVTVRAAVYAGEHRPKRSSIVLRIAT